MKIPILLCLCTILNAGGQTPGTRIKLSKGENIRKSIIKVFNMKIGKKCPKADDFRCPRKEVIFWLYTRDTQDNPTQLDASKPEAIPSSVFAEGAPLKILVHGYKRSKDHGHMSKTLIPAFFKHGEYNIIFVDWSVLCSVNCYVEGALSLPTVGTCLAQFMSSLLSVHEGVFSSVHYIGHGSGSQALGWTSTKLKDIKRITQLEPTFLMFFKHSTLLRRAQAEVVDVWHTNINFKGRSSPTGTIDIFFNDAIDQPGCGCDLDCSHDRVVLYYAESLSDTQPLMAFPCVGVWESYTSGLCRVPNEIHLVEFGDDLDPLRTGVYLAFTHSKSPFIIPGSQYLAEETLKAFKSSARGSCKRHKLIARYETLFRFLKSIYKF